MTRSAGARSPLMGKFSTRAGSLDAVVRVGRNRAFAERIALGAEVVMD